MTSNIRRLAGGKAASQTAVVACFFGPLVAAEFRRLEHTFLQAEAPPPGHERARLSMLGLARACSIVLPPELTIPIQRAPRDRAGGFAMRITRDGLAKARAAFAAPPPDSSPEVAADLLRLRSAIETADFAELWRQLFLRNFGVNYANIPSYKQLMAKIAVICAGIELFLLAHWDREGRKLVEDAPRLWADLDMATMVRVADRTGVSEGVVLATVIQLAAYPNSAAVRAALREERWEPLHEKVWGALFPDYADHTYFQTFVGKTENPGLRPKVGRPEEIDLARPDVAVTPPMPESDVPPSPHPVEAGVDVPTAPPVQQQQPPAPAPQKTKLFTKRDLL